MNNKIKFAVILGLALPSLALAAPPLNPPVSVVGAQLSLVQLQGIMDDAHSQGKFRKSNPSVRTFHSPETVSVDPLLDLIGRRSRRHFGLTRVTLQTQCESRALIVRNARFKKLAVRVSQGRGYSIRGWVKPLYGNPFSHLLTGATLERVSVSPALRRALPLGLDWRVAFRPAIQQALLSVVSRAGR